MPHVILFELLATLAVVLTLVLLGTTSARQPRGGAASGLTRCWSRFARRRRLVIVMSGAIAFLLPALITLTVRWPVPAVHDEFSYLLAADTFAHGRLANPPHPFWKHFESVHIVQQPAYASKYPPAQGAFLAIGQILFGLPLVGAWAANACAAMAMSWMCYGWLPRRWAAVMSIVGAAHPLMIEWGLCYWGGAIPALGGALVLGALTRLLRAARPWDGALMAVGAVVLANSRPFEGLLMCLLPAIAVAWWLLAGRRFSWRRRILSIAPGVVVLTLGAGFMAYYNFRVTGDWKTHPHVHHARQYASCPEFLFQTPPPPVDYRHETIRNYHQVAQRRYFDFSRTALGLRRVTWSKVFRFGLNFLGFSLGATLLWLAALRRRPRGFWLLVGVIALTMGGHVATAFAQVHYLSPVLGAVLILVGWSLEGVGQFLRRKGRSELLALTLPLLFIAIGVLAARNSTFRHPWGPERAEVAQSLREGGGEHLVFVRYPPQHDPTIQWVYNDALIDNAPVVWAHDLGAKRNKELAEALGHRNIWLFDVASQPPRLIRQPPSKPEED